MKRILLFTMLFCLSVNSFAQNVRILYAPTRIGLFGGAGIATSNNYDLGISGGLDFDKWVFHRTTLGASVFLQGYNQYYDNEANGVTHGLGDAGVTLRHSSKYVFVAPQLKYLLWHRLNLMSWININAGVGMRMSGFDSLRKWDHSFDSSSAGRFDSTIDASKNINSMLFRLGVGFTQDLYMGRGNFWFTFKEEFGFITSSLTKTAELGNNNPSRTPYSPQRLSPGYISFSIGITYINPGKPHRY